MPVLGQLGDPLEVARRLRHLPAAHEQVRAVDPEPRRRAAHDRRGLGDLVLVVGEDVVLAAGVDVERRAEVAQGHRRALEVPAREALAPAARPVQVAADSGRRPSTARSPPGRACPARPRPRFGGRPAAHRACCRTARRSPGTSRPRSTGCPAASGRRGPGPRAARRASSISAMCSVARGNSCAGQDVHQRGIGVEGRLVGVRDLARRSGPRGRRRRASGPPRARRVGPRGARRR